MSESQNLQQLIQSNSNNFFTLELDKVNEIITVGFTELSKNLEQKLVSQATTSSGKKIMKEISEKLILKIEALKKADIEMLDIFRKHIEMKDILGINEPLQNIYGELFFLQVKLINDTFYKLITNKQITENIKKPLKELFDSFHKKIRILNSYLDNNKIESKMNIQQI